MKTKPIFILAAAPALTSCNQKKQEESQVESKSEEPRIFNMIYVEGGEFTMGNTEFVFNPPHQVTLNDFYMSDIEVTQGLYEEIMGVNPVEKYDIGINTPVYYVSWYEALEFCNRLSLRDNYTPCYEINGENVKCNFQADGYRLPTDAEWEYAARGGRLTHGYKFSGSNEIDNVAYWWGGNYDKSNLPKVAQKNPNELGIYDLTGSVEEWCWDWASDIYDFNSQQKNPTGPKDGIERVCRGDSVFSLTLRTFDLARSTTHLPQDELKPLGFRICRTKVD